MTPRVSQAHREATARRRRQRVAARRAARELAWLEKELARRKAPVVRGPWYVDEIRLLRAKYSDTSTIEIARELRRSLTNTYQKARKLGLSKSAEYLASPAACRLRHGDEVGKAFRFKPGQVPQNKGLRRPGYAPGRMAQTQFKKREPKECLNYVPIGTEKLSKDGYLERKVTDDRSLVPARRWRFVHVLEWERVNGPVPKGHAVAFRNGDKRDIRVENLELITRRELLDRNSVQRFPPELRRLIQLKGAVQRQVNKRIREREEQAGRSA